MALRSQCGFGLNGRAHKIKTVVCDWWVAAASPNCNTAICPCQSTYLSSWNLLWTLSKLDAHVIV